MAAERQGDLSDGYTMQMPAGDKPKPPRPVPDRPGEGPRRPPSPEPPDVPEDDRRKPPSMPPPGMPPDDRPGRPSRDGTATTAGTAWVGGTFIG